MICIECDNCIEDYMGKPYCFIGQFQIDEPVELTCDDFRPKGGMSMITWIYADLDMIIDSYSEPPKEEKENDKTDM